MFGSFGIGGGARVWFGFGSVFITIFLWEGIINEMEYITANPFFLIFLFVIDIQHNSPPVRIFIKNRGDLRGTFSRKFRLNFYVEEIPRNIL